MKLSKIIKLFKNGNVCVVGEKGSGKDMLTANVIARRNLPYISNVKYDKKNGLNPQYFPLEFDKLDCGGNTYKDFVKGELKHYEFPYPIGTDVYISDVGVYFPSQFCNELNRDYKFMPTFMALSRHLGDGHTSVHINVQNLNRAWDKLREQSRTYITCLKTKVFPIFGKQLVVQKIRIYEKYDSCCNNVPSLHLPWWTYLMGDKMMAYLYKLNYCIQHGEIKERTLVYFNRSSYDTHIFRTMLKNAKENQKNEKMV